MIRVKHDNQYISYILEDNSKFFPTGYRVLKKQRDKGFIPCYKVLYNGHIKLMYPVSEYSSVSALAENWNMKDVYEWILRILKVLMEVQDNGFIQMDTVDVDLSHIFINVEKKSVHIIALPLMVETGINSLYQADQKLEKTMISLIEISQIRDSEGAQMLKNLIHRNISSLDILYKELKNQALQLKLVNNTAELINKHIDKTESFQQSVIHFVSKSAIGKADIIIDKEPFVLGKNPKIVDGVLRMSPTISRKHCMITQKDGVIYIEDLDSVNHTYVNGEMVKKGEKVPVRPGDQIRLAEVEFELEFRDR